MQTYDILMLVVLAAATLFGLWKGLAWQVASLAAIFASYFVALNFREPMAAVIPAEAPWNIFVAMLVLYIGTSAAIWLTFRLVAHLIDRVKLKEFDHQLGALLGMAKGVLLCVLITLFAVALAGDQHRQQIYSSRSGYYIAMLLDRADAVMPSEIHEVLHPYLHSLDGIQTPRT